MATTSPDNIRTPNPTDNFNLVADLATTASDVQDALTRRANAYKGTASQRGSFTSTAVNGMLWQDTDGIKMIWRKDGAVWVPAVWRWSGTTSQMNTFAAPDGFVWYSTTDGFDHVRLGGAWRGGTVSLGTASGVSGTITLVANGRSVQVGMDVTCSITNDTPVSVAVPTHLMPVSPPGGILPIPVYLDPSGTRERGVAYYSDSDRLIRATAGGSGTITRIRGYVSWIR